MKKYKITLTQNKKATINWRFTTDKARIKLLHLYPSIEA